jgi:glycosyltransferase involved in cell wall biosynthesis
MPRQLLIAHSFPPLANAESVVTALMVRGLAPFDWQTTALCASGPAAGSSDNDLLALLPDSLRAVRVAAPRVDRLWRLLRIVRLRSLAELLTSLPDNALFWSPGAKNNIRRIVKAERFDAVQSRSFPITNHRLGYWIRKKFGIPWIAHFGDPWIDSPFYQPPHPAIKRLHRRWEQQIFETADAVTFTTDEARRSVMANYAPALIDKCHIVPHGYDRLPGPEAIRFDPRYCTIVYTGSFYGKRTPLPLLNGLQHTPGLGDALRIILFGRMPHAQLRETIRHMGLETVVEVREPVAFDAGCAAMAGADVLLTIDTADANPDLFLPSKVIEYLGWGKPVFGVVYPNGISGDILRRCNGYVADIRDPANVADGLTRIVADWRQGRLQSPDLNTPAVRAYSLPETSKRLVTILEGLTSPRRVV